MKIAWVTPFSNKSAIGMVGREICEELSKECDIDIWAFETEDLIETSVNVIQFNSSTDIKRLDKYDHIFYNMGNFAGYHREVYDLLSKKSGYVVIHDQTMSGFWEQYYLFPEFGGNASSGFEPYKLMFKKYYGQKAEQLCQEAYDSGTYPISAYKYLGEYKLIEPLLENAKGVFTHAYFFADKIKDNFSGPVGVSYLPCKQKKSPVCTDEKIISIVENARNDSKSIIVTTGIVHPVKNIDKVTEILCESLELRSKFCYIVIGSYGGEYGDKLENLSRNELKGCLHLLGYQPQEVMEYAISNADICINMRYPNSEVCSLSLLEQMSFSKPVIVINSGIYGEMPDNVVIKINKDMVKDELKKVLENDLNLYFDKGAAAGTFVKEKCSVEEYVRRLLDFCKSADSEHNIAEFKDSILDSLSEYLCEMNINESSVPATTEHIINKVSDILNGQSKTDDNNRTLGIWAGFLYHVPGLHREGIARFISFLCENLVKHFNVDIEVWSYSFNESEMENCFSEILNNCEFCKKIKLIHEKNFMDIFEVSEKDILQMGDINEVKDNLSLVAREFSKADIFMPLIVYLDNVVFTGKKILVPAHDMAVARHYDDFLKRDKLYKSRHLDILYRAENLVRNGAKFSSNCKIVMENQILKYIRNLKPEDAYYVYLPVNIPDNIENKIMPEDKVRELFNISGRYLFYPTQVRPYKNISTLVRAFNELKNKYADLKLVLTGNPKDMPEVDDLLKNFDLYNRTVTLGNISESELYSVYKYASVVPVTSKFEGGFPWQACEALFMKVPLVLSNIDVVEERMKSCGFSGENSQILLFEPTDYLSLSECISEAIDNKKEYLNRQEKFSSALLSWDWKQAAGQYYKILFDKEW